MKRVLPALAILTALSASAQNSCETALPVTPGQYTVDAVNGAASTGNCPYDGGNATAAEWYSFTSPVDTGVMISSSIAGLPYIDTRIQVYSGTCASLVCVAGDDDSGGDYSSIVSFSAAANVTYIFAFDNNWEDLGFVFELSLYQAPPPPVNLIDFTAVDVPNANSIMGAVDMNGDGLDDLVCPSATNVKLFRQMAGGVLQEVNIPTTTAENIPSWSMAVGDLDKNGRNDLLYGGNGGVTFMFATDDGTGFDQVSGYPFIFCQRTNMVDLNNDGHLDAFSCHDVDANVGFLNDGNGNLTFSQGGYGETCGNYGSVFTDYNNDGLVDLFVAKCGCDPIDQIMPNSPGGIFTDVAAELGLDDDHQSWSSAWGDYDNDGDMDVMIGSSSSDPHKLMRNNGDGTFTNISVEAGVFANEGQSNEWTTHDFNNDGWLDILGGDGMLMNNGDFTFTFDNSVPYNGPIGDMDNDGYLDIMEEWGGTVHYNQSTGNNWLKVLPIGSVSNYNGIGARVHVMTPAGNQIRDIKSGDGFAYMSSLNAHFGLGAATGATVEVHWPSGIVDVIENVQANTTLVVNEGLFSGIGGVDVAEFVVFPVPATDRLTISGLDANNRTVRIFSATGQLVHTDVVRANTIGIEGLNSGVYLLEVNTTKGLVKRSFVKQ